MVISFQIKSMISTQQHGGASVIVFNRIDITPTPTPQTNKQTNHSIDGDTTVSMCMF